MGQVLGSWIGLLFFWKNITFLKNIGNRKKWQNSLEKFLNELKDLQKKNFVTGGLSTQTYGLKRKRCYKKKKVVFLKTMIYSKQ